LSFEFSPHKLVYGGDALGHHQGRAVLVPRALPGERLEVEELRTAKGVVHALPLRIIEAAPERVDSPCPYFGHCGGCQYQHLGQENQTAAKREILRETLRRIGKIVWDSDIAVHVANPWNYRNQAQFKVAAQSDGQLAVGFFEAESHRLTPIDACLILSPRLNAVLSELRKPEWSARLVGCREIELLADDQDERVMLTLRGNLSANNGEALAKDCLSQLKGVVSVAVETVGGLRIFGDSAIQYRVGEFNYRVSPTSFFQASRFLLSEFVSSATTGEAGEIALDLFAGVGLLTLPLARRFGQVMAVEANAAAAADLSANATAHALLNIRAAAETTFDFLRRFARNRPDLVVLDPPRTGVDSASLKFIAALQPQRIHYVSCHPPTLARDLGFLVSRGYEVKSVEFFDFFPQTFHIESILKLARKET
jgi:23S rRNA (uracil1939-C5)-methyltransferase